MHVARICGNYKYDNAIAFDNNSINNYNRSQCNFQTATTADNVCFMGNPIKSHKIGETIENLGLVIRELSVRNCDTHSDEECYLLYKPYENGGTFRLMKKAPEKLKELSEELKAHPDILEEMRKLGYTIFTPVLEAAKEVAPRLVELFDELTISEITYARLKKEKPFEKLEKFGYKPINPNDRVTAIYKFFLNQKKYAHAAPEVVSALFKALTKDNIKRNVVVRASGYGKDRVSPFNMYSRYGFKPLSATADEIDAHKISTSKGLRLNPDFPVLMYLPEDALLYRLLRDRPDLDEINRICPGWFNLND